MTCFYGITTDSPKGKYYNAFAQLIYKEYLRAVLEPECHYTVMVDSHLADYQ